MKSIFKILIIAFFVYTGFALSPNKSYAYSVTNVWTDNTNYYVRFDTPNSNLDHCFFDSSQTVLSTSVDDSTATCTFNKASLDAVSTQVTHFRINARDTSGANLLPANTFIEGSITGILTVNTTPAGTTPTENAPVISSLSGANFTQESTYNETGSFTDSDSTSWTGLVNYGDGTGNQSISITGNSFTLNHQYVVEPGNYTVTAIITDNQGISSIVTTTVVVNPSYNAITYKWTDGTNYYVIFDNPNQSLDHCVLGGFVSTSVNDSQATCVFNKAGLDNWITTLPSGGLLNTVFLVRNVDGLDMLPGRTTFDLTSGIFTTNTTPPSLIINSLDNQTVTVGDNYSANGTFIDPGVFSWSATVDYGDGAGTQPLDNSGTNFTLNHVYTTPGNYTVTVTVTDSKGATATKTTTVTVNNASISVGNISVANGNYKVNTATAATASFTEPGATGTHTAVWNWGDGTTSNGTITESNGSGSVTDSHTYGTLGSYTVVLTVTDIGGLNGTSQTVVSVIPANGLHGGNLSHKNYSGADLSGQNISNANLSVGTFNNVNFQGSNLSQVNGSNSSFTNDNFTSVNANKVNFSNSNLSGSNFTNAILTQANLSNSNLTNADFTGANLQGANLSGTTKTGIIWSNTTCPNGTNSNSHGGICIGQGGGL